MNSHRPCLVIPADGWRSSSYSQANGGECVEWNPACASDGVIPLRDSKCLDGSVLIVSTRAFAGLVQLAKLG